MEKQVEFKIKQSGESVTVGVSIHDDFLPCANDMPSPFKHGQAILPPGFATGKFKSVVIKCMIKEEERGKIARVLGLSGEGICHEVVEQFVKDHFRNNKLVQSEDLFCNHYEMQYKYLIVA